MEGNIWLMNNHQLLLKNSIIVVWKALFDLHKKDNFQMKRSVDKYASCFHF